MSGRIYHGASPNYSHEFPDNENAWEFKAVFEVDGVTVLISKVGGGTLGRSYAGAWHYDYNDGEYTGSDLVTGTPKTHTEAAVIVHDIHANSDELEDGAS